MIVHLENVSLSLLVHLTHKKKLKVKVGFFMMMMKKEALFPIHQKKQRVLIIGKIKMNTVGGGLLNCQYTMEKISK